MADLDWKTDAVRFQQIERRLFELGALVKGNLPIQADRVADCVEQIHELRKELADLAEKQKAMREYVLKHVKEHKNGGTNGPA